VAPPDVPAERVKALRAAFQAMVADPQFQAAAKTRNASLDPATGEALQEIVAAAMVTPKDVVERTRAIVTAK
jgi:tripartite-type tricarboxylate transporter receptor subunit TctC